ncbi:NAD(P)H-binding protein [Nocardia thailandica]|uniref:NAD(P)H-binding protein n=1 Tax=Nocardia thailandica TaxID=257275 RepID=UPI0002D32FEF|nr:NAD(P)H-binding protein [Nocardia thailandica]
MRIAVTTPTGNVGSHVVAMLVRAGIRPLVLARRPARLPAALRPAVDTREVDQFDSAAVVAATAGVDALYWVDPPAASPDPLHDYARATASVAEAVRRNGIGRVVFQSSAGAELRHGAGEIDGLAGTEVALDRTGADMTHLRCGYFFSNLGFQTEAIRVGLLRVSLPVDQPFPWVAPRDIAEVAVTRLLSTAWRGRHVQGVHGPEDLSWRRVADLLTDATGRTVRVEQVPDDVQREQLLAAGLSEAGAAATIGMSAWMREGFAVEQPRSVFTTTPTTLAEWLTAELRV